MTPLEDQQELPPVSTLSSHQQRGVDCVFCGKSLQVGQIIDLGPRPVDAHGSSAQWFPRRCRRPCLKGKL
ncbi:hypothetical protein ABT358_02630 [Streptomyces sp. NPDC000341]|uniref:hypothetical protein n=1 Tax=Streptomyces sp. NPDC000341 TaxID=3156645 RepID=UPI00332339B6